MFAVIMIEMPAFDLFNLCCANSQPCPFLKPVTPPSHPFSFSLPLPSKPKHVRSPTRNAAPLSYSCFRESPKCSFKSFSLGPKINSKGDFLIALSFKAPKSTRIASPSIVAGQLPLASCRGSQFSLAELRNVGFLAEHLGT